MAVTFKPAPSPRALPPPNGAARASSEPARGQRIPRMRINSIPTKQRMSGSEMRSRGEKRRETAPSWKFCELPLEKGCLRLPPPVKPIHSPHSILSSPRGNGESHALTDRPRRATPRGRPRSGGGARDVAARRAGAGDAPCARRLLELGRLLGGRLWAKERHRQCRWQGMSDVYICMCVLIGPIA